MARLAHLIRTVILGAYEREPEAGKLHTQFEAFRETLIPDLKADVFADMYAQTIAYGLFGAACQPRKATERFTREKAAWLIPKTNPFLRKLFAEIAGPDLDDRIRPFVDDLVAVLRDSDLGTILADFGKRTGKEDPVVHFYEDFLQAYDPKVREMRGVYYTPEPVVSYIVRSVDHLLKTRFNKPDGLADKDVLILDPACGTGTFLYYVIQHIHNTFVSKKGQKGAWNSYVSQNLLKRVFGFELLMAPYAVAHLKLGLLLQELGYKFDTDERLGIYLTNTLEEAIKRSEIMFAQWIADEANAAAEIKKEKPIMVVIGNPPYSGHSANRSWEYRTDPKTRKKKKVLTFIGTLLQDYYKVDGKPLGEMNPKWLQDDYVKFIRFGQWRINKTGYGILAYISNNGYLDNPTFRGMRQQLLNEFSEISILDLHGSTKKKERAPDGSQDNNIFDIQQGVGIGLFVKEESTSGPKGPEGGAGIDVAPKGAIHKAAGVVGRGLSRDETALHSERALAPEVEQGQAHHAHLWGERDAKCKALAESDCSSTPWQELTPRSPSYLFVPRDADLLEEYERGWKLNEIFLVNSVGIVTARDHLSIHWSPGEVWKPIKDFADRDPEDARQKYELGKDARDWKVHMAQEDLRESGPEKNNIVPILYRPFDVRYTYYTGNSRGFICMPRPAVMRHMLTGKNLALVTPRRVEIAGPWMHLLPTRSIVEHVAVSLKTIDSLFPLYIHQGGQHGKNGQLRLGGDSVQANISREFIDELVKRLGHASVEPEDVFHYISCVLHCPTYRTRYAEFMKIDFPRVPLTSDKKLFPALVEKGRELVTLHLMESPTLNKFITRYPVSGDNAVDKVRFEEVPVGAGPRPARHKDPGQKQIPRQARDDRQGEAGRVYINKTQYFEGVPEDVWEFHIGGYQVCQKWLKDRKGRQLTNDDLDLPEDRRRPEGNHPPDEGNRQYHPGLAPPLTAQRRGPLG